MNTMGRKSAFKTLIIAISGVTCSGKTSLARMICENYPSAKLIRQDDFFLREDSGLLPRSLGGVNHANWDCMESIDMQSMMKSVHSTLAEAKLNPNGFIIVDGFLVLNYALLAELYHLKYFLTLPRDVCTLRRGTRQDYDPPDPPGYFDHCVWPMYEKHLAELGKAPYAKEIQYLDGTRPVENNLKIILADVESWMNGSNSCS